MRSTLAAFGAALAAIACLAQSAAAQHGSEDCLRLEAQLAALGRPKQADPNQIRQAAAKQQSELDRTQAYAKNLGCGPRFIFAPAPPAECGPLGDRIKQMQANLDRLSAQASQAGQAPLRALAGCFGFPGDEIEKKCRVLSGGEKARLVMALLLFDPPNLLVLDEPTNHLDIATKQMLIAALSAYEGTMLFVSHDRHFLAALSNRVLELTPEGIHKYGGGYTEYVLSTGHEAPGLRS